MGLSRYCFESYRPLSFFRLSPPDSFEIPEFSCHWAPPNSPCVGWLPSVGPVYDRLFSMRVLMKQSLFTCLQLQHPPPPHPFPLSPHPPSLSPVYCALEIRMEEYDPQKGDLSCTFFLRSFTNFCIVPVPSPTLLLLRKSRRTGELDDNARMTRCVSRQTSGGLSPPAFLLPSPHFFFRPPSPWRLMFKIRLFPFGVAWYNSCEFLLVTLVLEVCDPSSLSPPRSPI